MEQPLGNLRVLDLGQIFMGPYCGLILSHLGADVIKVEPPSGENVRGRSEDGHPPTFQFFNANKRGLTLDLKSERGRDALKRLVEKADVLIENFRPDTMAELGVGYEELKQVNEELVYGHASGYGATGPHAQFPAMDLAIQARSGIMASTGFADGPPVRAGPAVCDILGGVHLAVGIMGALHERNRTGEGQYVDVGMLDCVFPALASSVSAKVLNKDLPERTGNRHSGKALAPYNAYEADDGYVTVICINDMQWRRLTETMDRPELASRDEFRSKTQRADHVDLIDRIVEDWVSGQTRDEVVTELREADVPCAPVQSIDEVLSDRQLQSRGMVNELLNRGNGESRTYVPGRPFNLSSAAAPSITPAPRLGEHTEEVLRDTADYSEAEIRKLEEEGAF